MTQYGLQYGLHYVRQCTACEYAWKWYMYVRFAATMVTTMDVDVDELCSNAVLITPIIRPQIGFSSSGLWNASPARRPAQQELLN